VLVNLPPVSHPEDEHEQLAFVDFIDHAVVTGADAPLSRTTNKASGSRRTRVLGQ
jgi:hypothetical protein